MFKNPGKMLHIIGIILFGIWCTSKVINIISPEKDNLNILIMDKEIHILNKLSTLEVYL